jgi:hypothetical protein
MKKEGAAGKIGCSRKQEDTKKSSDVIAKQQEKMTI